MPSYRSGSNWTGSTTCRGYNAKGEIFGPTLEFFGSNYDVRMTCKGITRKFQLKPPAKQPLQ